ncbi:hypothetical protein GCM10029963_37840 [Micromonospora andamanensis]|uniref:hypothetical protein n=1 Tax=Micromonospora andamanensis TaxID=1287068 RepID=UPI001952333B|nr:hypothetical protein [Micromonospora andamanensis]GIJ40694.1 hypothetical protein Vwe01_40190 [Micromonospora andamanensis]
MTVRRLSAGLVAVALFTPGVAACTATGDAGPTATPSATASGAAPEADTDAKQALLDSTREIRNGNFRFSMSGAGSVAEGQVHQPSQSAEIRVRLGESTDDLAIGLDLIHAKPDSWVKLDLKGQAATSVPGADRLNLGKYQHLDQNRIKGNRSLGFDFEKVDPAGSEALTQAVTDVQRTGDGAYAGTLDLSKAADAGSLDPTLVTALGAEANSVPFTATTDAQGRLTELVIKLPEAGRAAGQEIKVTYSDYGNATAATKPSADQVVEAPPELYNLLD